MLRFIGGFFQNNLSQAQQHTVLLHFPSGTFGLQFRRNFCFDINFAIHIQNPEAKWKITCKFSFLFRALLSCSNVRTKMLWPCGQKNWKGGNQSSVPNPSPYPHSPGCPLFTQVSWCSPVAQKAQPSPPTLAYRSTLSPIRPPSTHRACHSDGPGLTDMVNIHFHWAV